MLTERNDVHSKRKRLQYTELQILLSISLFYCKCTVKWITEIDVGGYICTAKTFFFKMRIWSPQW